MPNPPPANSPHQPPSSTRQVGSPTLIFGCGYLGKRVAESLIFSGRPVSATTRSVEKASELKAAGINSIVADWTDPSTLGKLPQAGQILVSVSYDRASGIDRRAAQVGGLRNLLRATDPAIPLCYISTTGIYHQTGGEWVDENSATKPTREAAQAHLEAEELLRNERQPGTFCILRLAGIYGPGRVPRVADVASHTPIASRSDGYLNLIHVEDAAQTVLASWDRAKQPLYLVCDDEPVLRRRFYQEIASNLKAPEPLFVDPADDASPRLRSESNKRIRNTAMKRDLVPQLKYPDYRLGLANIL